MAIYSVKSNIPSPLLRVKGIRCWYLAAGEQKIFICDDSRDVFFDASDKIAQRQLTGHNFIQTINIPR